MGKCSKYGKIESVAELEWETWTSSRALLMLLPLNKLLVCNIMRYSDAEHIISITTAVVSIQQSLTK